MNTNEKWYSAEIIERRYEESGNLKRAQVDYVRSVASSLRAVLARLGDTPNVAVALNHLDGAVLWATREILNDSKQEAA